jgi:hypothetical protein
MIIFNESSSEWSSISESDREEIGFRKEKDGEFWFV